MPYFYAFLFTLLLPFLTAISCETTPLSPQTYIVRVQNNLKPSPNSDVETWYRNLIDSSLKPYFPNNQTPNSLLYIYDSVFHGFSAVLTPSQAEHLRNRPEVLDIFPERVHQIHTTRSPGFLGLVDGSFSAFYNPIHDTFNHGNDIIIGLLDTGIWPERPSFVDETLGPVPSHWKGKCVSGEKFSASLCNKKLIGARYYSAGYEYHVKKLNISSVSLNSPRDTIGHGTHTASIAAGRLVGNVSFLDHFARGNAQGIANKARIAVYKVCWEYGCSGSDILAALDDAVNDGVDVISMSLGSPRPQRYIYDEIAIGSFAAVKKGIVVSTSAGNAGAKSSLVTNVAPWIITVGAGTIDRHFPADLILESSGIVITGSSLWNGNISEGDKFFPLIYAGNASVSSMSEAYCLPNSLDPNLVRGKIVVCDGIAPVEQSLVVKEAGGVGVISANVAVADVMSYAFLLPGLSINQSDGQTLLDHIKSSSNPRAKIIFRGTQLGVRPAPVLAYFSSRGPNDISSYIMKPDLIAPGVDILAAWPVGLSPTGIPKDTRQTGYNIISGTSMSCPHVSGVAALLKAAHPDWSPAMMKSAMMTTAYKRDRYGHPLLDANGYRLATPWNMGSGHVDPLRALDPGLVYDIGIDDYVGFLCASNYTSKEVSFISGNNVSCEEMGRRVNEWDLNYPAISVVFNASRELRSRSEVVVKRTVTYVGDGVGRYAVKIASPKGVHVSINVKEMEFREKGEKDNYEVRIVADDVEQRKRTVGYGSLTWTDGTHFINSPILVRWL